MRKQLQKLLVLLMIPALLMSGCANGGGESTTEGSEAETVAPPITVENIAEYVVLGQYMGIEAVKASTEPTDEEIEEMIKLVCEQNVTQDIVSEGVVQKGDTVYISYEGKLDGVAFEGGTGTADLTIGSGQFIAGFEDGLIGVEVGSTVDLDLTFPDPYKNNPDLAGKPVVFTVTVKYLYENVVPEFDDELAKKLEYENVEEMREALISALEEQKIADADSNFEVAVWKQVIDNAEITRHDEIYDFYYNSYIEQYTGVAAGYSMTLEQYVSALGSTIDEFYKMGEEYAVACMNQELVCRAVVEKEQMTLTDEEYQKELSAFYEQYKGYYASEQKLEEYYGKDRLINDILWSRVIEMVVDSAVVVEKTVVDTTEAAQ